MRMEPNQPEIITHRGIRFTLVEPWSRQKDTPITRGPFYSRPGVNPEDWVYLPDAVSGWTNEPVSTMHCIQARPSPETRHPGSVF